MAIPADERALLGALMFDADWLPAFAHDVKPGEFTVSANGAIYAARLAVHASDAEPTPGKLADELDKRGQLGLVGGREVIWTLVEESPALDRALDWLHRARWSLPLVESEPVVQAARELLGSLPEPDCGT